MLDSIRECKIGAQDIIGVDYNIMHDSNLIPIPETQAYIISVGPAFYQSNGLYGISIDIAGIIGITISFTGSIYYGGN